MSSSERSTPNESYFAYVIGLGILLAIVAMMLTGFGTVSGTSTTSMLLVGLALIALGLVAWLFVIEPWTQFDDLKTPYYTGHAEPPPTAPETAADAHLGQTAPAAPAKPIATDRPPVEPAPESLTPPAQDDLTAITGLGPKSQQALYDAGLTSYRDVATATPGTLRAALDAAGLTMVQPDTWPEQATLLSTGEPD